MKYLPLLLLLVGCGGRTDVPDFITESGVSVYKHGLAPPVTLEMMNRLEARVFGQLPYGRDEMVSAVAGLSVDLQPGTWDCSDLGEQCDGENFDNSIWLEVKDGCDDHMRFGHELAHSIFHAMGGDWDDYHKRPQWKSILGDLTEYGCGDLAGGPRGPTPPSGASIAVGMQARWEAMK